MNTVGKSDGFVVPPNRTNKAGAEPAAESAEGREPTKKNAGQADSPRAPKRKRGRSYGLAGVRETARAQPELKFTSLLHHVNEDLLTSAFFDLKKSAAVGIDEVTWHDYELDLEERIVDLHGRIHRGSYRAKPSAEKRVLTPGMSPRSSKIN
jgi:RNA-directed DNA polymerase